MRKIQTQGVNHITLAGADRQTSIDFWEGVPGMPFVSEQPNLGRAQESHLYFAPRISGNVHRGVLPSAASCQPLLHEKSVAGLTGQVSSPSTPRLPGCGGSLRRCCFRRCCAAGRSYVRCQQRVSEPSKPGFAGQVAELGDDDPRVHDCVQLSVGRAVPRIWERHAEASSPVRDATVVGDGRPEVGAADGVELGQGREDVAFGKQRSQFALDCRVAPAVWAAGTASAGSPSGLAA